MTSTATTNSIVRSAVDWPYTIASPTAGLSLVDWAAQAREQLTPLLQNHKALLLRGFNVDSVDKFQAFLSALGLDLLEYTERSTPRSTVVGNVYTSTEYPKAHEIPMHNENSYSGKWPRRVYFCCLRPAAEGGETPIADSRKVYEMIEPRIREEFISRRVMYMRNYGQGLDLSWEEAFQTDDRSAVERYCRESDIAFQWSDNNRCLQTRQVRPAALMNTLSGERVWFNQAHLFHVSALPSSLRKSLLSLFPADQLPRNACFGNGSSIPEDYLDHIRDIYRSTRTNIQWCKGDVLMLDNLFCAHGRLAYSGDRQVIVAMDGAGSTDVVEL